MTTRNLDALFEPRAIALIGASNKPRSVGGVLAANLLGGGFAGPVMTVNPREETIRSTVNYRSVAELPVTPDLAVIATPPPTVPGLVAELGARGCRAAVIVTAGFGEGERAAGQALRQQILDAAQPHTFRIVGPNCLGFLSPGRGINASFAQLMPAAGHIAFVSQSGAVATAILDWAAARRIGFSHVVSLGDMADVDFGDLLDWLALDRQTRAILLYVESVTAARKFMTAGRIAARTKPVIVVKSGRGEAGARAAVSHTGALAGADAVYDAAFRRAGMLRVTELRELFEAVTTLSAGTSVAGDRLAVVTNGGGLGVVAVDALEAEGGRLAALSAATMEKLEATMPAEWSHGNPVDVLGDASGARYAAAIDALAGDPGHDALLVINCPTAVADSMEGAEAVVAAAAREPRQPILTAWMGETAASRSRDLFIENRLPTYETPEEAVRAFMQLVRYRRNQALLMETPPAHLTSRPQDRAAARTVVEDVLAAGRLILTEPEAKAVLAAYGIPTVPTRTVAGPAEAGAAARELGGILALKILSPDITHKSDIGGVRLSLEPAAVEPAAVEMLARVRERMPAARVAGFTVQPMVRRPEAHELIVGIADDATFGPVLLFGQGGTATEVIGDRAIGLPPLNRALAAEMIRSTRIAKMLAGFRDRRPADVDAVAGVLVDVSEMLVDLPEIAELDINPLLADADGVVALDARIVLRKPGAVRAPLAIRPYPAELETSVRVAGGAEVPVRPIRPEDEPKLVAMFEQSTAEDRRLRFFAPVAVLPHTMAARLSQIDYDREMAFVAFEPGVPPAGAAIIGGARLVADPNYERAEFAVMVRSDWKGRGLGYGLLATLIAYGRRTGLAEIHGEALTENTTMLRVAAELGFAIGTSSADPGIATLRFDLRKDG